MCPKKMSVVLSSDGQRDREERSDMGRVMQKRNYRLGPMRIYSDHRQPLCVLSTFI